MRKYVLLSCKRNLSLLPRALLGLVCAALALSLFLALAPEDSRMAIAIVGTTEDPILEMGMVALQNLDSSRYTLEVLALTEEEAKAALQAGRIAAYGVIPEDFAKEAGYGRFLPITLVTGRGSGNMVEIFKSEITQVLTDLLAEARKGVFGIADALEASGLPSHGPMNQLALEYVERILARDRTYEVRLLGIGDGLGLADYLPRAFSVLLMCLACLSFGTALIREDMALPRLLASRGVGALGQTLCEFFTFYLCLGLLALGLWAVLGAAGISLTAMLIAAFCLCAVSYLFYQLSTELIGGTVLQFLLFAAMAFVSGCMYPVYFFPETIQRLALWLPTGAARLCLGSQRGIFPCLVWGFGSLLLSVAVRRWRLTGEGR